MASSHRALRIPHRILTLALFYVFFAAPAAASLSTNPARAPQLVDPPADATVYEGGLKLAWRPAAPGERHYVMVSRQPFDARSWTRLPEQASIRVHEVARPVVSLADLGLAVERDRPLYWAAAGVDPATGRATFSETRALSVIPRFSNAVAPTPHLSASSIVAAAPARRAEPDRIRLRAGYVIEPGGAEPALPSGLRAAPAPGGTGTFLVYYGDADPAAVRDRILAAGGRIAAYIPDHTFLVRTPAAAIESRDAFAPEVGALWTGPYHPAYKLSPRLEQDAETMRTANVLVFEDGDLDGAAASVAALGGRVARASDNGINKLLRIELPGAALAGLAAHPDVAWIEPHVEPVMDNRNAQWVVQTAVLNDRRVWEMGIHGEGQIVMTSDSGVALTHDMFRDPLVPLTTFNDYPTHRKVIAYKKGSDNPAVVFGDHNEGNTNYHGTHTAGTVVGNNDGYLTVANVDSLNDGMAKGAKLYFMDISGPLLLNSVDPFLDLNDLFLPPYLGNAAGAARIASNSWGAPVGGAYDLPALTADQFMWSHPDFLIFFANGNAGPTVGSVASPATAKNVVGAGGTQNYSLDINAIYELTSRGPTDDNRRKPTICSPGQSVRSSISSNLSPYKAYAYATYSGTSMASPSMAGAAALIRQYLTDGWYPTGSEVPANGFEPSAALLKAMCINSAANTITGFTAPDNNVGYGRIKADDVLYFAGDARRLLLVDFTVGLAHGEAIEYQVNVVDGAVPLEVALCWTDYPGNPASTIQLVNNLDLTVTNGVVTYKGNVYSGGVSTTGGSYDDRNVEEATLVSAPATGLWTIRIDGTDVPVGPQPFGLCITGGVGTNAGVVALDRPAYGSASTVEIRVVDTDAGPAVDVTLTSATEPSGETVTLTGADGVFTGTFALSPFDGTTGDDELQVSHGDVIVATYEDASPVATLTATAGVSIAGPVITDVVAENQGGVVTVGWNTDRSASSKIYYGLTPALGEETALDPAAVIAHQVTRAGLAIGTTYYYDVESQDLNGNVTRDDNGGQHYRFTVNPPADLLLVIDDNFDRPNFYPNAFSALGWDYDTWGSALAAEPQVGDTNYGLRAYKAVWWQPGLEQYPPVSDAARDSITKYLGGGGRFAICGHDIAWALGDPTSTYYSAARASWLSATLHATFQADPPDWANVNGIAADPISNDYVAGTSYSEHRAGASGDEINAVAGAGIVNYVWRSNESTPDDCGIRWQSGAALGTPGTALWAGQVSRLVSMFFEWTGMESASQTSAIRNGVMQKTLAWLIGRGLPVVAVTAPNGGELLTGDDVSISWTETPAAGTSIAARRIEYSVDGGQSWTLISGAPGASPYLWDLTAVPNTGSALVRVTVDDNGTPAFSRTDASNAVFAIERAGGDAIGPAVVAGSIAVSPNPVDNQQPASLSATVSDATSGGADVTAAEWSFGASPAAAGAGAAMTGGFPAVTVAVSAAIDPSGFDLGVGKLWVRGRDAEGNWGGASALSVVVNGQPPTAVGSAPMALELRQNVPNPVAHATTIAFATPARGPVALAIHDVQGRQVRALLRGEVGAGLHSVPWDRTDDSGRSVEPGVYYLRLVADGRTLLKRMVTLR